MATAALRGILVVIAVVLGVVVTLRSVPQAPAVVGPQASETSPAPSASPQGGVATPGLLPPTTPAQGAQTQAPQGTAPDPSKISVQVLNGTNTDGLAATTAQKLEGAGYKISAVGNAQRNYQTTTIFYRPDSQPAAQQMANSLFPGAKLEPANNNISPKIHITVVIGEDQAANA